jgi:D-alanyl-lipoteichoic acid acyltransferase DltB (MBOAT superfamily)
MKLLEILEHDPHAPLVFTSGTFFLFFTVFIATFAFAKSPRARFACVLVFSLFYYYKCNGLFMAALVAVAAGDYWAARLIARSKSLVTRKVLLTASIVLSLSLLVYFKYTNFLLANFAAASGKEFHPLSIFLPVGISFYTFESISYVIDVYRGDCEPAETFLEYSFFLVYFPHSVAGPIVRARDLLPQIRKMPLATPRAVSEGLGRIVLGLVKKALIADYVGAYSDLVFSHPRDYTGPEVLLGVYAYALQIFFDFSGYSDIALGISRVIGIELCENFDAPYRAKSITEFWRRWHMSLSTWLRDYVYIPLGGNRHGRGRQYLHLFATMLIGGLWHGASWTFVVWGGLHGLALAAHKLFTSWFPEKPGANGVRAAFGWILTLNLVVGLWVVFRAPDLSTAGAIFSGIPHGWHLDGVRAMVAGRKWLVVAMAIGGALSLAPNGWTERLWRGFAMTHPIVRAAVFLLVAQGIVQTRGADITPFIYFQF